MHVAVIGAGAAGLASARHVLAAGHSCEVLESKNSIGGVWVYTDDIHKDKYGFPVHSAMYKGLRTNLPKEVMGFPDFPIEDKKSSYMTQTEILNFLNLYAQHFNIHPHVKLNRHVANVKPTSSNKWLVKSIDKITKKEILTQYDAVIVCNGHYNVPKRPPIKNQELFQGPILHSQQYRSKESFRDLKVLIIGAGPSGIDLSQQISSLAEKVVLSHHSTKPINTKFDLNVQQKPDVLQIAGTHRVDFVDGSFDFFDAIILCTGYKYDFPFLDESCGITIDNNYIQPLYKHMIHIEKPTLCFVGVPFEVCAFHMFDLQARYFVKTLNGSMKLPTKGLMYEDTRKEMERRWAEGYTKKQAHSMGPYQQMYYDDLAESAQITPIPTVITLLRNESVRRLMEDSKNFRNDRYKIVDNEHYVKVN